MKWHFSAASRRSFLFRLDAFAFDIHHESDDPFLMLACRLIDRIRKLWERKKVWKRDVKSKVPGDLSWFDLQRVIREIFSTVISSSPRIITKTRDFID